MTDHLTVQARSRLMSRVRTRDTGPELALRKELWSLGVRGWRLHPKSLPGRPDLVFRGSQLAIFVDGAFWHGHPDYYKGQSGPFWDRKIARNRARDRTVDEELVQLGWNVLRFWDFQVERSASDCAETVREALRHETNKRSRPVRSRR
jgi:DNA mismatch endonuclease, patch repair protein